MCTLVINWFFFLFHAKSQKKKTILTKQILILMKLGVLLIVVGQHQIRPAEFGHFLQKRTCLPFLQP